MIRVGNSYKLFRMKQFMSKNGNPYIRASINDSERQQDGSYKDCGWYMVTIFKNADEIAAAGKIKITAISSIQHDVHDYNGRRYDDYKLILEGVPAENKGGYKPDYESAMYDHPQPTQGQRKLDIDSIPGHEDYQDGDLPF